MPLQGRLIREPTHLARRPGPRTSSAGLLDVRERGRTDADHRADDQPVAYRGTSILWAVYYGVLFVTLIGELCVR
jgi:hypothetical protein